MTRFPDDDDKLAHFLRRHQGAPPPARPDLEEQLMAAVEAHPLPTAEPATVVPLLRPERRRRRQMVSGTIAASLVIGMVGYQLHAMKQQREADLARLEDFIETSWNGTVSDPTTDELFPL